MRLHIIRTLFLTLTMTSILKWQQRVLLDYIVHVRKTAYLLGMLSFLLSTIFITKQVYKLCRILFLLIRKDAVLVLCSLSIVTKNLQRKVYSWFTIMLNLSITLVQH